MADRTRTYLPTDWSIWVNQSETGSFIWDFSEWDNGDVWGTTGNTFSAVDLQIENITFTEGSTISQGIFSQATPNTLNVTFNTQDFNTNLASKFLNGSSIELRLKNENTESQLEQTVFFMGYIDSVSCDVQPGSDFATISVSATSVTSKALNTLVSITKNTTSEKGELITTALDPFGFVILTDVNHFANSDTEEKTVGEWLQDALVSSLYYPDDPGLFSGIFQESVGNGITETFVGGVYYINFNYASTFSIRPAKNPEIIKGTFDADNITNVTVGWQGEGSPTGVNLTLASNSSTTYKKNAEDNGQPGMFTYSGSVDVKNLTELTRVGNTLLEMSRKFAPMQITAVRAKTYEEITFQQIDFTIHDEIEYPTWFRLRNDINIGQQVGVELLNYGIDDSLLVTGKTHEITPDSWTITYDLWKGFTA
jgi:hypothetical protein